ncbi:hypothetical protein AC579_1838 [Pseudocercospora musae]|uniref:Uncharacterized protein n=1 Tax=Pseudocercospora musae TaxID=113226 RepID=A0A139I7P7_9PEZI|nr:hypothetical protein AC579_1838 [Pseudocercospora musae]
MIEHISLAWALRITGILVFVGNLVGTALVWEDTGGDDGDAVFIFAVWIPGTSYGVLVFFALLIGATIGTFWAAIGPLCAEVAGLAEVPSFLFLQWLTTVLPCTFAEVVALYPRRPSKGRWGYLYAQLFAGLSYLVASIFMFELWRIKIKQAREERRSDQMEDLEVTILTSTIALICW